MKNIVCIGSSSPFGKGAGISTYATELALAFVNKAYKVIFVAPQTDIPSLFSQDEIEFFNIDPYSSGEYEAKRIVDFLKNRSLVGIINNDNIFLQNAAPLVSVPFVSVGHLEKYTIASAATFNHEFCDHIVSISSDMQTVFSKRFSVPLEKCPIIYNGIDCGKLPLVIEESDKSNLLKVVYCGGWNKRKGADLVFSSLKEYPNLWRGSELNWFGELPQQAVNQISHLKATVHVHGKVDRKTLFDHMCKCDLFLMPSRVEGCPMALLEAMGMGLVPITSNGSGAMRWIVQNGRNGFVGDLKLWSKQAAHLVAHFSDSNNSKVLVDLKTAAQETIKENFTSSRLCDDIIELFSRPTVKRTKIASGVRFAKWHRPLNFNGRQKISHRLFWRIGLLRYESKF